MPSSNFPPATATRTPSTPSACSAIPRGYVWHKDNSLGDADCVIVPGGFSYGDYLRCGAIARFSPVMQAVKQFADNGGLVLGICNGFQVLTEAGLLPGALIRNRDLQFHCEHIFLKTATPDSPFTNQIPAGKILRVPIAHGEGCYFADEETLAKLKANNQILWQYCDASGNLTDTANPNGALQNIAGICNERRNVAGLMPHPERASEPAARQRRRQMDFRKHLRRAEKRKRRRRRHDASCTSSRAND